MRLEEITKKFNPIVTNYKGKTIYWFTEESVNRRRLKCYYDVVDSGKLGTKSERQEAARAYVLTEQELRRTFINMKFFGYVNGHYKDNKFKTKWSVSNFYGYIWVNNEWQRVDGVYHLEDGKFVRNAKTIGRNNYKVRKINTVKLLSAIIMYFNKASLSEIYNVTGVTPTILFNSLKRFAATGKVRNKQILPVRDLPRYADIINSVRYRKDWKVKAATNGKIFTSALLANTYNVILKSLVGKPDAKAKVNFSNKCLVLQGTKQ